MAERSSTLQATQLGVETTPGTSVPANKKLLATSFHLKPAGEIEIFRPWGYAVPTLAGPGREWVEVEIDGWASYQDLPYLWSSLISYPTPVPVTAGISYSWTHTLSSTAANTIKTYTVEEGGAVRAQKATYVLVNEVEITFDRKAVRVRGKGIGQALTDGITMTASPTELIAEPILPKQWAIFVDNTSAGLGGTRLTRVLSGRIRVGDRYKPLWVVNDQVVSFVGHTENPVVIEGELLMEADATGMSYLTPLRDGSTRFVRFDALGSLIPGTSDRYRQQINFAAKFSALPDLRDEDGVYAVRYALKGVHDTTYGKALEIFGVAWLSAL